MRKVVSMVVAGAALMVAAPAQATINSVLGGDLTCTVQGNGDRFCGSDSSLTTSKTFDGMPIDMSIDFPPKPNHGPDGKFPLVIVGHGYGGSKSDNGAEAQALLDRGFAVFRMTDRGFNGSCGNSASKAADPSGCADGYIRLMDDRYEVRDAQYFAGKLADEGLVAPKEIAATGGSYGGGISMALAALKDRTMMPSGKLVPWKSPQGKRMRLAAAVPVIPWTDLAASLVPNGSTLDYVENNPYSGPVGIEKQSLVSGLYLLGCTLNFCSAPGVDPDADLTTWKTRLDAGEPYQGDSTIKDSLNEIKKHHSSFYINHSEPPAPLLIANGYTDDLFPVDEAIRFYNRTKGQYPNAPVGLFFGDFGHPRAQNKPDVSQALAKSTYKWLDHYVQGKGKKPFRGVTSYTQTCPSGADSGGPYRAANWAKLNPGEVRLSSKKAQTIDPSAGDPSIATTFDPVTGGGACATADGADQAGVATYRVKKAPKGGYTLLGSATVVAKFKASADSEIAARLLDVGKDGNETLVARGLWRPKPSAKATKQVFQLHPGGWTFAKGDVAKLELLPRDAPYGRASNDQNAIKVSHLSLRLPVHQKPGALGGFVRKPAKKVLPKGAKLAPEFR